MRATRPVLVAALALLVCSCGASSSPPGATTSTASTAPWSFGDEVPVSIDSDVPVQAAATADPSVEGVSTAATSALPVTASLAPTVEPTAFADPCALMTREEWAAASGQPLDDVRTTALEHDEACGYLADRHDTVRAAVAYFDSTGFLESSVPSEEVSVGSGSARWAGGYPAADGGTLVLPVGTGELVVELSARGPDAARARDVAVAVATVAGPRAGR